MKKLKKFFRFCLISIVVLAFVIYVGRILLRFIWNFDILNADSYKIMYDYWEKGGVFNTFRDCSLGIALLLLPIIWLILSYKLYKYGFWKFIFTPVVKVYRHFSRPKNMEVEHVSIKNLGAKDKTLDEIISEKIKEKEGNAAHEHMAKNIRQQIAAKIEENTKQ